MMRKTGLLEQFQGVAEHCAAEACNFHVAEDEVVTGVYQWKRRYSGYAGVPN